MNKITAWVIIIGSFFLLVSDSVFAYTEEKTALSAMAQWPQYSDEDTCTTDTECECEADCLED